VYVFVRCEYTKFKMKKQGFFKIIDSLAGLYAGICIKNRRNCPPQLGSLLGSDAVPDNGTLIGRSNKKQITKNK
jgi:hypothetical protein